MEKKSVVKKLDATVKMLRGLKPNEFDYSVFVQKWETVDEKPCGTVCCVAGWYPKYFPKSGLQRQDRRLTTLDDSQFNIRNTLAKFHGISEYLIGVLFYGQQVFALNWPQNMEASLPEVIERFETVIKWIEDGGDYV